MRMWAGAILLLLLGGGPAGAQTVINPRIVEFTASVDHDATLSDGNATVTRYEVRWFMQGASTPFQTTDIGKPAKPASGPISVDLNALFAGVPIGVGYTVRVAAIGPTGEGESAASNPFEHASPPQPATSVTVVR